AAAGDVLLHENPQIPHSSRSLLSDCYTTAWMRRAGKFEMPLFAAAPPPPYDSSLIRPASKAPAKHRAIPIAIDPIRRITRSHLGGEALRLSRVSTPGRSPHLPDHRDFHA